MKNPSMLLSRSLPFALCLALVSGCGKKNPAAIGVEGSVASGTPLAAEFSWLGGTWQKEKQDELIYDFNASTGRFVRQGNWNIGDGKWTECSWIDEGTFRVRPPSEYERDYYAKNGGKATPEATVWLTIERATLLPVSENVAACRAYVAGLAGKERTESMEVARHDKGFQDAWYGYVYKKYNPQSGPATLDFSLEKRQYYSRELEYSAKLRFKSRASSARYPTDYEFEATAAELVAAILSPRFQAADTLTASLVQGQSACGVAPSISVRQSSIQDVYGYEDKMRQALKTTFLPCLQQILYRLSFANDGTLAREIAAELTKARDAVVALEVTRN